MNKSYIRDFIKEGKWDRTSLSAVLPHQIAQEIIGVDIGDAEQDDDAVWIFSDDGNYANKTAWQLTRCSKNIDTFMSKLWHKAVPFKMSFLSWRLCLGKLPFNEAISKFGRQSDANYLYCRSPFRDSIQHTFTKGEATKNLWNYVGRSLGINHHPGPIRSIIQKWRDMKTENDIHKIILQIAPVMICWEIWKEWTSCKYEDQNKMLHNRMDYHTIWNIQAAIHTVYPTCNFTGTCPPIYNLIERFKPKVIVHPVTWKKPERGHYKINVDGSYKEGGNAGIGGILRDCNGDFILSFSWSIQCISSTYSKAITAKFGSLCCVDNGLTSYNLEMDSLAITKM